MKLKNFDNKTVITSQHKFEILNQTLTHEINIKTIKK